VRDFTNIKHHSGAISQIAVVVEAVTLVGAKHHEEPVDNALRANWPNNNERCVNRRHDPLSGDDVVQVADVVAV